MADYTSEEVQAVVEKLVMSTIRRPYDTLGVRRTDISFTDVQEAAAGVFILYPNAPFYVLYLGAQRLNDLVTGEAAIIEKLLDAIDATGRNVLPVEDVSTLFNAQAALQELGSAAAGRAGVFADITKAPAYQRFSDNVNQFLGGPGQNVKSGGAIAQTPQQARSVIPGLMAQLREAHELLVERVALIAGGIDDYNRVNLPSVVASSVLSNSSKLVGADAAALDALTPTERLALIRQTVLDVLAVRAVVTTFGSFSGPSDYYTLEGMGQPYSDALHEAIPAEAVGDIGGAAGIVAGVSDQLTFAVDGGAPFSITLNPSTIAQLEGFRDDSGFIIGDGVTPVQVGYGTPNNNVVKVKVGATTYVATLTLSGTMFSPRTADQVAADINASLPASVRAEGYYAPLRFSGLLDIPVGVDQTWTLPVLGSSDLLALGVTTSDTVHVLSGPNAGIYPITAVSSNSITVTGVTVLEAGAVVEIGRASRRVRIRLNDPVPQLAIEETLMVVGDTLASQNSADTLGLLKNFAVACKRTTHDLVATDINTKTQALTAGTKNVYALENIPGHTDVLDATKVVLRKAAAVGSQLFAGLVLTYTVTGITTGGTTKVGDVLVLRDGPNPGQFYTVTAINGLATPGEHTLAVGDILTAAGTLTGTPISGVACELGPNLSANKYDVVTVLSGPNADTYFVQSQGDTPLDVLLQTPFPLFRNGVLPLDVSVSFGKMVLSSTSRKKTIQSQIIISGSAANFFFSLSPTTAVGKTPWFQLPVLPRGLQPGDVLETYPTSYKTPSASYKVTSVGTPRLIGIESPIPSTPGWQFTVQPPPFARLRVGTMNDFGAVKSRFELWLSRPENEPAFFTNFNRLVNPLLVNENPTAVQVGTALNELKKLYGLLMGAQGATPADALDTIVASFVVQTVEAIDTLLQSFVEKGSNRANDLLLQGQFSVFFGLTVDGASYAGAFQEAARAVAMNDLPVRRFNRPEAQSSQLRSQSQSPDFEFTAASINETVGGAQVDPPTSFGEPSDFGRTD